MGATAAVAGVAAVIGGYQIIQGEKAAAAAVKERKRQETERRLAERELNQKQLNEQALDASKARRLKSQGGGGQSYMGKGGTVLTSPQGVTGGGGNGLKTVLGQ